MLGNGDASVECKTIRTDEITDPTDSYVRDFLKREMTPCTNDDEDAINEKSNGIAAVQRYLNNHRGDHCFVNVHVYGKTSSRGLE